MERVKAPVIPDSYFDRFETKKYRSRNPAKRWLIGRFLATAQQLFDEAGPVSRVLEVGVGEGFISGWLSEQHPGVEFWGVDLSERDIELCRAKFPRVRAQRGTAYDLSFPGVRFDLVICAEVLEHLEQPGAALSEIRRLQPRRVVLSVPHEPWFSLSNLLAGKNVARLGNDQDHRNRWAARGFLRLIEGDFTVERLVRPFPWLVALATPRRDAA